MRAQARYFPVKPGPRRLTAGLIRFGTMHQGNGAVDASYFQIDACYEHYLREKRAPARTGRPRYERHGWLRDTDRQRRAHEVVLDWMRDTLHREHPERFSRTGVLAPYGDEVYLSPYDELVRNLQEDVAVVQRTGASTDELIMAHVCFPSDWRSEQVLGKSFLAIHMPVPDFADDAAAAASMVSSMVDRGPYVRFVWSVCADDHLDHHPEHGTRAAWGPDNRDGWLRVERQVTVPFPAVEASLFLIRPYLYALSTLSPEERGILAMAVTSMPDNVRRYKGMDRNGAHVLALLERLGTAPVRPA